MHINQLQRIMHLTAFFLLLLFFKLDAKAHSQNVSFTGTNVELDAVFKSSRRQTGYYFSG